MGHRIDAVGAHAVSIDGADILLDGEPFTVLGLRCSNALVSDAATASLIASLPLYKSHGVNSVSVYVMGSRFGDVAGYTPDAELRDAHAARLARILESADAHGMLVLVGCLYWGASDAKEGLDWDQADAERAVANTVAWLDEGGHRNVIVDPDNEGMSPFDVDELIRAGHAADSRAVIANNDTEPAPAADLNVHFGPDEAGKPYFDSEGTVETPMGGYWTPYSKESFQDAGFYNYSRIGRYTPSMKERQIQAFDEGVAEDDGYMAASTWLQAGPGEGIAGPFASPGGHSEIDDVDADRDAIHPDAGILWLLEHLDGEYGPYEGP